METRQPVNKASVVVIHRNRKASKPVKLLDNNRTDKIHLSKANNLVKDQGKEKNRRDNWPNHKVNNPGNNRDSNQADNNQASSQANNQANNREANKVEVNPAASRLNLWHKGVASKVVEVLKVDNHNQGNNQEEHKQLAEVVEVAVANSKTSMT